MKLSEINSTQRKEAVKLLYHYLKNPGLFSILVLGEVGVGKSHWIRAIQEELQGKSECTKQVTELSLTSIHPTKEAWKQVFTEANGGILVLTELEKVKPHDALLFEALTTYDGKYGFEKKEFNFRVVFTSSYSIDSLRKTEEYVSNRLFDRVSQLVVKLPSFADANRYIWDDFQASWNKMQFQEKKELPGSELKKWLESKGHSLKGNFRDLDKIAILWHQFRLMGIEEGKIWERVKEQFEGYSAFPEQHTGLEDAQKRKKPSQIGMAFFLRSGRDSNSRPHA
jgi:transcriptional regulator with AAA-type ATPase domain